MKDFAKFKHAQNRRSNAGHRSHEQQQVPYGDDEKIFTNNANWLTYGISRACVFLFSYRFPFPPTPFYYTKTKDIRRRILVKSISSNYCFPNWVLFRDDFDSREFVTTCRRLFFNPCGGIRVKMQNSAWTVKISVVVFNRLKFKIECSMIIRNGCVTSQRG